MVSTLAGCSAPLADPVFASEDAVASASCTDGRLCVEVWAPVVGGREGAGSVLLNGPGRPEALEPLAERGNLGMHPEETTIWRVDVDGTFKTSDLHPVCGR